MTARGNPMGWRAWRRVTTRCAATLAMLVAAMAAGVGAVPAAMANERAERGERAIHKQVDIDAGLDEAWAAWTTREGIVGFFAPDAVIDARPGGAFHIHIDPLGEPGMKGADDMRYLAVQPKRMLSFDWNAPPHLAQVRPQRTFVIVRFEPLGERRTRVTLHHTGWGDGGQWDQAHAYFDRSWGNVLANLKKRFENGPIDWSDWMNQLRAWHKQKAAAAATAASAAKAAPGASSPTK